ncbi:F0F1 ATP synthase subunit delta [Cohaesibacter celericrescens]|uniref:F0F1 ATP synthase subunit delta n=1 Tax=Cohaesibacter celericrescens TaxID=2067669 RepID=UPI003565288A
MSIDWITVVAQLINFLVLVWLLKHFLYRPILDGIDAREAEISSRMQEALLAKKSAEATEAAFNEKVRALKSTQSQISETIRKSAEEQRDALLAKAHQRMEQEKKGWQAHLEEQARVYMSKVHSAGASALLALTRKALSDLADETLEERMAHHLLVQIKPLVKNLHQAAGKATVAVVTSHSALSPTAQDGLVTNLKAEFPQVKVQFKVDQDQAPGLILRLGGAQVAWTVDTYIEGLEALISGTLARGIDLKEKSHDR